MIHYSKMSLFDAPEKAILLHGCNAQGVWGAGIAKAFREKYPRSFAEYNEYCKIALKNDGFGAVGTALITAQENKRHVGCLITSYSYGRDRDSVNDIVAQTYLALDDFFKKYKAYHMFPQSPIFCNMFNSGMFKVPWEKTDQILQYFTKRHCVDIMVCDPVLTGFFIKEW